MAGFFDSQCVARTLVDAQSETPFCGDGMYHTLDDTHFRLLLLVNGENRLDLLRVAEPRVKPVRGRGSVHNRAGLLCQHPVFVKRTQREYKK